jgi:hypothetical protein
VYYQGKSKPRCGDSSAETTTLLLQAAINGDSMIRKYSGDKKSIEARSDDNGRTWSVKLFESGRLTEYTGGTLAEVDALALKHGMTPSRS